MLDDDVGGEAVGGAFGETGAGLEGGVVLGSDDFVDIVGGGGGAVFEPDEEGGAVRLDGLELVAEREETGTSKP